MTAGANGSERVPIYTRQQRGLVWSLVLICGVAGLLATLTIGLPDGRAFQPGLDEAVASVMLFRAVGPHLMRLSPMQYVVLAWSALLFHWVVYLALLWRTRSHTNIDPRLVLGGAVVLGLIAIVTPPVASSDVFMYAIFGRISAVYDVNPYLHTANAVASNDPMFPLASWPNIPTPYGPVWTMVSAAIAGGHGTTPLATVLRFKVLSFVVVLADGLLIHKLVRRRWPAHAHWAYLAFAWNPLVLVEGSVGAHNDALILGLVLVGMVAFAKSRTKVGVTGLTLAGLVKYTTLPLLAIATLPALKRTQGHRARIWMILQLGLVMTLVAGAAFLPYWHAGESLLLSPAAEADRGVNNPTSIGFRWAVSLATGGNLWMSARTLTVLSFLVFGIWMCISTWLRWRTEPERDAEADEIMAASASACVIFLALWPRIHTWYFLIPLGLVIAAGPQCRRLFVVVIGLCLMSYLSYLR